MTQVRSAPGGSQSSNIVMNGARWPAVDGWVKMTQRVNGIEVHHVRNTVTGAVGPYAIQDALRSVNAQFHPESEPADTFGSSRMSATRSALGERRPSE